MQWKDVDFEQNVIHVSSAMPWDRNRAYEETPKSEKGYRDVPILTTFRPMLLEQKAGHADTDYVMSGEAKPLSQSQYEWRWAIYCRDLGLSEKQEKRARIKDKPGEYRVYYKWKALVTAHQFRHFYATNLFTPVSRTWWPRNLWVTQTFQRPERYTSSCAMKRTSSTSQS